MPGSPPAPTSASIGASTSRAKSGSPACPRTDLRIQDLVLGELHQLPLEVRGIVARSDLVLQEGHQVALLLLEAGDLEGEGEHRAQVVVVPRLSGGARDLALAVGAGGGAGGL